MSLVQKLISLILFSGHCGKEVYFNPPQSILIRIEILDFQPTKQIGSDTVLLESIDNIRLYW